MALNAGILDPVPVPYAQAFRVVCVYVHMCVHVHVVQSRETRRANEIRSIINKLTRVW